ncbi:MAG TPA: outer membrane beta-barrel protein [Longimicrobiaceae bacterium]|nr:outer membrane beta-barrel protein [Longimicrobiaceae bacterium]
MRRSIALLAVAAVAAAAPLGAQSGFALKGHYVFNESEVREGDTDRLPVSDGFSLGAELVLPFGVGVGLTGYTTGRVTEFERETTSFGVLGEANYFLRLPVIPLTPYAGVHAGLGKYKVDDLDDPDPEFKDDRNQLGWQAGVRWQINSLLGVDAQFRRVSESAAEGQDDRFERSQFLLGVTLF